MVLVKDDEDSDDEDCSVVAKDPEESPPWHGWPSPFKEDRTFVNLDSVIRKLDLNIQQLESESQNISEADTSSLGDPLGVSILFPEPVAALPLGELDPVAAPSSREPDPVAVPSPRDPGPLADQSPGEPDPVA